MGQFGIISISTDIGAVFAVPTGRPSSIALTPVHVSRYPPIVQRISTQTLIFLRRQALQAIDTPTRRRLVVDALPALPELDSELSRFSRLVELAG